MSENRKRGRFMTRCVHIRRYSVLRTANLTLLGYVVLAVLLSLLFSPVYSMLSSEFFFDVLLEMLIQIPIGAVGVWVASALVVLLYNHVFARFRCLRIKIEIEESDENAEQGRSDVE